MTRQLIVHINEAAVAAQRKKELGWIHQGKAALGWSDDDYRYHLTQRTGKNSAADLDAQGRRKVLEHMAACGFKLKPAFKPFGQAEKIQWLWRKLGETGALQNTGEKALLSFASRMAGRKVDSLRFLDASTASTIIEALKAWLDRARICPSIPQQKQHG